jgi:predicted NACHT family NTPase
VLICFVRFSSDTNDGFNSRDEFVSFVENGFNNSSLFWKCFPIDSIQSNNDDDEKFFYRLQLFEKPLNNIIFNVLILLSKKNLKYFCENVGFYSNIECVRFAESLKSSEQQSNFFALNKSKMNVFNAISDFVNEQLLKNQNNIVRLSWFF